MLEQPLHFSLPEVTLDIRWFPSLFSLCPNGCLLSWPSLELVSMVKAALRSMHQGQELSVSLSCIMMEKLSFPLAHLGKPEVLLSDRTNRYVVPA